MKYWAIGLGDWVEVRKGSTPPITTKTFLSFNRKVRKRVYPAEFPFGLWGETLVRRRIPIYNHEGGVPLLTTKKTDFFRVTKSSVPKGKVVEITKEQLENLGV